MYDKKDFACEKIKNIAPQIGCNVMPLDPKEAAAWSINSAIQDFANTKSESQSKAIKKLLILKDTK